MDFKNPFEGLKAADLEAMIRDAKRDLKRHQKNARRAKTSAAQKRAENAVEGCEMMIGLAKAALRNAK